MDLALIAVIVGLPIVLLLFLAGYAYLDAPEYGMNPRKWAAISFFIPFFGFFAYLFERDERKPDDGRDEMFADGVFEIHKSRADDTRLASGGPPESEETSEEDGDESTEFERTPEEEWQRDE